MCRQMSKKKPWRDTETLANKRTACEGINAELKIFDMSSRCSYSPSMIELRARDEGEAWSFESMNLAESMDLSMA